MASFLFPTSLGLYGVYEDTLRQVVQAKSGNVATMNQLILYNAYQHVYSPIETFAFWYAGKINYVECGSSGAS